MSYYEGRRNRWFSEVCLQRLSLQGGYETGLFAGVMVLDVVLVGIFPHCPLKVNSVASHVVALSELHRIFAVVMDH